MPALDISGLKKSFPTPDGAPHTVIDVPSFTLAEGTEMALRGESGSGKTTFLNLIAGILQADAGRILISGQDIVAMSEAGRDARRARYIGYVFQTFNLLQGYTALENVVLGMMFGSGVDVEFACELLDKVGLKDRMHYLPRQLSVGQQQRVALARALANRPKLVLADEPTGNLDRRMAGEALQVMRERCREIGAALLLVSHDGEALAAFDDVKALSEINRAMQEASAPTGPTNSEGPAE